MSLYEGKKKQHSAFIEISYVNVGFSWNAFFS